MSSNRFAFAALAIACITAAGVGGYLASRSTSTVAPSASAAAPVAAAPAVSKPVQETEAVVADRASHGQNDNEKKATPVAPVTPAAPRTVSSKTTSGRTISATQARDAGAAHQDAPPVDHTLAAAPAGTVPVPPATFIPPSSGDAASAMRADDHAAEIARLSEPPARTFDELVIAPEAVLGLQIERTISTATARVEDRVDAHVIRDVRVGDKLAIASGVRAIGTVTEVDRGGKFKERARLGIRFHTLVLADGTRVPISTETIYRDGEPPSSAQKMGGGAVAGAILGAILGGAKGAAIGGAAGAGAGAAAAASADRSAATFPAGTQTTVRILSPVTITVER